MQRIVDLAPVVILTSVCSVAWIFFSTKSIWVFFELFVFTMLGFGLLYGLLQKLDPKHFDFVLNHIDEIKKEGKDACLSGAPKESNPYSGVDGDLWEAGYTASYNKKIKQ
ncbi:LOW QUALITY PROTEIN: hypothetical protein JCM18904_5140 [Vibrio sp. JCM 18904]|nr:LOW QUALITY PROTEIN: hypothetical protein JCM18904_5140 [Vibrio sp. JCM 18904]